MNANNYSTESADDHNSESAEILSELGDNAIRTITEAIDREVKTAAMRYTGSEAPLVRILDIGCGGSPYLRNLFESWSERRKEWNCNDVELELYLLDRQDQANHHWASQAMTGTSTANLPVRAHIGLCDYFDLANESEIPPQKLRDILAPKTPLPHDGSGFDIIVLSLVIHELRGQQALRHMVEPPSHEPEPRDPVLAVFKKLLATQWLRRNDQVTVLACDVFNWPIWRIEELEQARQRQFDVAGHADSPSAFLAGPEIVKWAIQAGFEHRDYQDIPASSRTHPEPTLDEKRHNPNEGANAAKLQKRNELLDDKYVGHIFRERRAYCLRLRPRPWQENGGPPENRSHTEDFRPSTLSAIRQEERKVDEVDPEPIKALQKRLSRDIDVREQDYDDLLGDQLFPSLAKSAAGAIKYWFEAQAIAPPQVYTTWPGINSLMVSHYGTLRGRYAHREKIDGKWFWKSPGVYSQCQFAPLPEPEAYPLKGKDDHLQRSWAELCFNCFTSPSVFNEQANQYEAFKDLRAPSIYDWIQRRSAGYPRWHTVTLMLIDNSSVESIQPHDAVSDDTYDDPRILSRFRLHPDDEHHDDLTGHTLIRLTLSTTKERDQAEKQQKRDAARQQSQIPHPAYTLGKQLDLACGSVDPFFLNESYSQEPNLDPRKQFFYSVMSLFLDALFLSRGRRLEFKSDYAPAKEWLTEQIDRFEERWTDKHSLFLDPKLWKEAAYSNAPLLTDTTIAQVKHFATEARKLVESLNSNEPEASPWVAQPIVAWHSFILRHPALTGRRTDSDSVSYADLLATIMLETDRPCHPELLELLRSEFISFFHLIRLLEAESTLRQDRNDLLITFAHSGQHDSNLLSDLLDDENLGGDRFKAARLVADNLGQKLKARQPFNEIRREKPEDRRDRAWESRGNSWISVNTIWHDCFRYVMLHIAVAGGSEWDAIRRKLGYTQNMRSGVIKAANDSSPPMPAVFAGKLIIHSAPLERYFPRSDELDDFQDPAQLAIRVALTEMILNFFRHELQEIDLRGKKIEARLDMPVRKDMGIVESNKQRVLADITCILSPAHASDVDLPSPPKFSGLKSIRNVLEVIASECSSRDVPVTESQEKIRPPAFPDRCADEANGDQLRWTVRNVPCFIDVGAEHD